MVVGAFALVLSACGGGDSAHVVFSDGDKYYVSCTEVPASRLGVPVQVEDPTFGQVPARAITHVDPDEALAVNIPTASCLAREKDFWQVVWSARNSPERDQQIYDNLRGVPDR